MSIQFSETLEKCLEGHAYEIRDYYHRAKILMVCIECRNCGHGGDREAGTEETKAIEKMDRGAV